MISDANNVLQQFSSGLCASGDWDDVRRNEVNELRTKHFSTIFVKWEEILNTKDSKEVWAKINWKGDLETDMEKSPEIEDIAEHFKSKDSCCVEDLISIDFGQATDPILDSPISIEEITEASSRIKEGKSTADGWVPKMITSISEKLFPILVIIFNIILQHSIWPSKWWYSVVVPLFKHKGVRSVAKFFRPVSLVEMLLKLFDFIYYRYKSRVY